ncbi:5-(carboxyamino)imidazole ribonucleotide synthase [Gracilinema caldarium]|uniref:N5-carboxyaminoimidazole ribonucleotide synthase n=1 Tax=Gracilinema caldarium (strain ATCC 51460 / DSM 7334 / H1) TaxID=744872 RepID=F8F4C1_GRAC1|nr:5-(carboxyamino)imidazole ribonucleotide synthase [Gracilinema caldarium]AEJ20568.1 phosphoribosylaminoimidazole carboxylase, ATPase subunit [Gracilinema caldarium DSM 7334]
MSEHNAVTSKAVPVSRTAAQFVSAQSPQVAGPRTAARQGRELRRIGILGGGQLARMLALAGHPLGLEVAFLDPAPDACAGVVARQVRGPYDDVAKLEELAAWADIITYEFENVPVQAVHFLEERQQLVYPPAKALATSRDRLAEKQLFTELGIPTPAFAAIESLADLEQAVQSIGFPAVLKTRTMGYDGKGQVVIRRAEDCKIAWEQIQGRSAILEAFVDFTREVSIIAVRSSTGEEAFYPVTENVHREGILRLSRPRRNDRRQAEAETCARKILDRLDYVGVLALELFDTPQGLMANETAPRVHNSGHWTIEGAVTSQFENHLRAILGLPLGATVLRGAAAMINCIGTMPEMEAILAIPGAHYHSYGKEARPGRKVGHYTITAETDEVLDELLKQRRY